MSRYFATVLFLSSLLFSPVSLAKTLDCAGVVKVTVNNAEVGTRTVGVDSTLKANIVKGKGDFSLDNKWDPPIKGSVTGGKPSSTAKNMRNYTVTAPDPDGEKGMEMSGTLIPIETLHKADSAEYWLLSLKNKGLALTGNMRCTSK